MGLSVGKKSPGLCETRKGKEQDTILCDFLFSSYSDGCQICIFSSLLQKHDQVSNIPHSFYLIYTVHFTN